MLSSARRRPGAAAAGRTRVRAQAVGRICVAAFALAAGCTSPGGAPADAPAESPGSGSTAIEGSTGGSTTLPARPLRSLADRAHWRTVLKWSGECEAAFQASHAGDDPGVVFHQLAPQLSLVEVLCAAGSYQSSSAFIRLDERRSAVAATVLRFPVYEAENGSVFKRTDATELWGEVAIDPAKPVMTVLNLARQTSDCGVWTRYDINGDSPEITDVRARLPCPARARPPIRMDGDHPPPGWRRIR